uniref:Uncharacterized protein n=1 Tax=Leviviridae sp. TaxID=2027243 RepID=A0A514D1F2_9VIRU|nr:MAG: hypothetical protein H3BulkLitter171541_000003 [Leviviridae sp.]
MTAAVDLSVLKSDGTTSIVWSLVSASGGDKSPAVWRSNTATGTLGQKPNISMTAKWNAKGDVRRVDISAVYPSVYTNTTTSQTEVRSQMTFQGSFAVPQNITAGDIAEFAAQIPNLLAHVVFKASVAAGYSPT